MSLILAAALLTQFTAGSDGVDRPPPTAAELLRADLIFARAQEESIAREPGTKAPEPYRRLFAMMGAASWRGREDATARLESAVRHDPAAIRWVFWGRRHHDPEIAARCNGVIRRAVPCPSCRGSGRSPSTWRGECGDCHVWDGDGYIRIPVWPFSPWD